MTDWTTEYPRGTAINTWEKELYCQNKEKEIEKDYQKEGSNENSKTA